MKKIVPDPPLALPIPYISIISDLSREEALAQAHTLIVTLNQTIEAYLAPEPEPHRELLLKNAEVLTQLTTALFTHAHEVAQP